MTLHQMPHIASSLLQGFPFTKLPPSGISKDGRLKLLSLHLLIAKVGPRIHTELEEERPKIITRDSN